MWMFPGALSRRRPMPRVRGAERRALLAPALLVAALALTGIGAGGIQHLSSLGQVAAGPGVTGGAAAAPSSGAEHAADVIVALAHDSLASNRQARATRQSATGGGPPPRGATSGSSLAGGDGAPLRDTAGVSPPSDSGGQAASVREPVGELREAVAEPVRDRTEPVDRAVNELLDELERVPDATPLDGAKLRPRR